MWIEYLQRNTRRQDANWIKKGKKAYYGYKGHISVDAKEGFILRGHITPASTADTTELKRIITESHLPEGSFVFADKRYASEGFCNSATIEQVRELDYVLTPGRYVGLPDEEDDFDFNERFTSLKKEFEEQLKDEERLNRAILENLKKVKL